MSELQYIITKKKKIIIGFSRPDFILLVKNYCVFRGEEKGSTRTSNPRDELIHKFTIWNYGSTPYVLGYYAMGCNVTFVALYYSKGEVGIKRKRVNICCKDI